jgi:hypothetical protein
LNDPENWRFSSLRKTDAPESRDSAELSESGVRRTCPAMRACARSTSARVSTFRQCSIAVRASERTREPDRELDQLRESS